MKPRKASESDAEYIARLEQASAQLRDYNKRANKCVGNVAANLRDAAMWTRLTLLHAAEITGSKDDSVVVASLDTLDKLMALPWGLEFPALPDVVKTYAGRPHPPGDAAMVATNALHDLRTLLDQLPHRDVERKPIIVETLQAARQILDTLAFEIGDALTDLEFTLDCGRPDIRPAAYAYFVRAVSNAIGMAYLVEIPRQPDEPELETGVPF